MKKEDFYKSIYFNTMRGHFWFVKGKKTYAFNKFGDTDTAFNFCHPNYERYYVDILYLKPKSKDVDGMKQNFVDNIDFTSDKGNILSTNTLRNKFEGKAGYMLRSGECSYTETSRDLIKFYGNGCTLVFKKSATEYKVIWCDSSRKRKWDSKHSYGGKKGKTELDKTSFLYMINHYLDKFYDEKHKLFMDLLDS